MQPDALSGGWRWGLLEINNLHKSYGDVVALAGCSFTVDRGQLIGFLGPNGSGKTTTMRTVFSLVRPERGSVSWNGSVIDAATRRRFGYMPEQRGLYPRMKILPQLVYFGRLHGMTRQDARRATHDWLEQLRLSDRAESRLEELSHGNQQRVQLAAALIHEPELLVLDEPFSGLDPLGVQAMIDILTERAARGTAVVFSSHQLDLVEDLCEEVVIISRGAVVLSGPVRDIRARSPRRYLDVEIADPMPGWEAGFAGYSIVDRRPGRLRIEIPDGTDLNRLVSIADQAGRVCRFSFTPPNLSEVFREVVSP